MELQVKVLLNTGGTGSIGNEVVKKIFKQNHIIYAIHLYCISK